MTVRFDYFKDVQYYMELYPDARLVSWPCAGNPHYIVYRRGRT